MRSGRGRIEVDGNVEAPFIICPPETIGADCTHVFTGVIPATFEYAVPGPYQIYWEGSLGELTPPGQTAVLGSGKTIEFFGEYTEISLPFYDPFDRDVGWLFLDEGATDGPSDWRIVVTDGNGALEQRSNIHDESTDDTGPLPKLGTHALIGSPDWTDYTVSVDVAAWDDDAVGIIARYVNRDNYYRFSLDIQRRYARLVARVDGEFHLLDAAYEFDGYQLETWASMALSVRGDKIEAFVDGQPVLSATDGSHPAGAVGLYTWGCEGVAFDDLRVEP